MARLFLAGHLLKLKSNNMNALLIAFACFAAALLGLVLVAVWAMNTPIKKSDDIDNFF